MAKGDWWFKFEYLKWLTDEQLNRCSLETQGFWMRCICVMRKSGTAKLQGTAAEFCRLLSVTPAEFKRSFGELEKTKAADVTKMSRGVTHSSDIFTIVSRKIKSELTTKEKNRLRQQKKRRHANVTAESHSHSKSNKKEVREREEKDTQEASVLKSPLPDLEIHLGTILGGVKKEFVVTHLTDQSEWITHGTVAFKNKFAAAQFLECLALLRQQAWRNYPVTAKEVSKNLPNLAKLRNEIRVQTKNGHGEKLPTHEENLADAEAYNAAARKRLPKPAEEKL